MRKSLMTTAALLALLTLAACGDKDDNSTTGQADPAGTTQEAAPPAADAPAADAPATNPPAGSTTAQ